jgi:hypothetical protein
MARPARSPLLGYNHNVKYGGYIFHVQTEDSGPSNPHLFTHLFFEGSILASKRGQYDAGMPEDEVRTMMQAQHKAILKELKQTAYDERIARFFSLRGDPFPAPDFLPPADETPHPVMAGELPVEEPPVPAAPEADVLDLDALPATASEKARTPEPLPVRFTQPSVPGPGTYTFRRTGREVVPPAAAPPPSAPAQAGKSRPMTSPRTPAVRPITPVVVQRQVVVGAGAPATVSTRKGTTTPVRRRPVSGGPYVVKEGSHVSVAAAVSNRRGEPIASPLASGTDPAQAPRTAEPRRPPQEASPSSFVTDQSLDDVILAYLSHGEGKR